ncbi:MAG TPA: Rieske (2Fe-2S) protein [Solirubrobacteraceae bacterium]|jgi:nitrite reductase/ring-hydroxylating ferredoxin subunit|nr:Rieske (2Fe-2S) protein [Solirubrobacteraceae bacterium]
MAEHDVGAAAELGPGTVRGAGPWVVVNVDGKRTALSRRCRHLRADLADGTIDADGCLVCPWHGARYDTETGRMLTGPQGVFAKIPGLDAFFTNLTKVAPLRRADVIERDGEVIVRG